MPRITKRTLLAIFKNQAALSRFLQVTPSYISRWEPDAPIPGNTELALRNELLPYLDWDGIIELTTKRATKK